MEGEEEKRINELVSVREVGMGRARGGREKERKGGEEGNGEKWQCDYGETIPAVRLSLTHPFLVTRQDTN